MSRREWPEWWHWELELSPHLRRMLERASLYREDVVEGRWGIETRHRGKPWEVIAEPDLRPRLLVVVPAYPVWGVKE